MKTVIRIALFAVMLVLSHSEYSVLTCTGPKDILSHDGTQCVSQCPPGYRLSNYGNGRQCGCSLFDITGQNCLGQCPYQQRQVGNDCACQQNFFLSLDLNTCVQKCGDLAEPDSRGVCLCDSSAMIEEDPLTIFLNRCICKDSKIPNPDRTECIDKLLPSSCRIGQRLSADQNQCVSTCGSIGEYLNDRGTRCVKDCLDKLLTVDGTQCLEGSCPAGQISEKGQCVCDGGAGFVLNPNCDGCIASCPSPQVSSGGKCACPGQLKIDDSPACISPKDCADIGIVQGDNCVKCEAPTPLISLDKSSCVRQCQYGQTNTGGKCVCQMNLLVSIQDDTCVQECGDLQVKRRKNCECGTGAKFDPDAGYRGKCVCNAGMIPNVENNGCITPAVCPPNKHKSFDSNRCVDKCTMIGEYLEVSGINCVLDCGQNALNAAGNQCVDVTQCGENQEPINGQCACKSSSKLTATCDACVQKCKSPLVSDGLPSNKCVCPSNKPLLKGKDQCVTVQECKGMKFFVSSDSMLCVEKCKSGEFQDNGMCVTQCPIVLDLAGEKCVISCRERQSQDDKKRCRCKPQFDLDTAGRECLPKCPVNSDSQGGKCVCKKGFYLSLDRKSCIEEAQCIRTQGFVDIEARECVINCNLIDKILDPRGSKCVSECYPNFLNVQKTQCVCSCTQNGAFIGPDDVSCVAKCQGPFDVDGSCVDGKECPPGKFLNQAGTQCVRNCRPMFADSKGKKCVRDCTLIGEVLNFQGKSCLKDCKKEGFLNSAGTQCEQTCPFISSDATTCLQKCPKDQLINLHGTQCVKFCHCSDGDQQFINLQGTRCVLDCNVNQVKNADNKCICKSSAVKGVDGAACILACGEGQIIQDGQCRACGPYNLVSLKKDMCVPNCESGGLINLMETACVPQCGPRQVVSSDGRECESECQKGETTVGDKCVKCAKPCKTCKGAPNKCQSCILGASFVEQTQTCVSNTCTNCKTCKYNSKSSCLTCNKKLYLRGDKCVQCKNPGDLISGTNCLSCIPYCDVCTTVSDCQQCADNYGFAGTSCKKCKDPYCKRCQNKSTNCVEYFQGHENPEYYP